MIAPVVAIKRMGREGGKTLRQRGGKTIRAKFFKKRKEERHACHGRSEISFLEQMKDKSEERAQSLMPPAMHMEEGPGEKKVFSRQRIMDSGTRGLLASSAWYHAVVSLQHGSVEKKKK